MPKHPRCPTCHSYFKTVYYKITYRLNPRRPLEGLRYCPTCQCLHTYTKAYQLPTFSSTIALLDDACPYCQQQGFKLYYRTYPNKTTHTNNSSGPIRQTTVLIPSIRYCLSCRLLYVWQNHCWQTLLRQKTPTTKSTVPSV